MAELCREFGISRQTGYKIFDRYQECGVQGLTDRSRRPYRYANQLPFQVENYILNLKQEHPGWGARKLRERLLRRFSGIPIPGKSTVHAVLDRHGLVERRGRVRRRAQGTALSKERGLPAQIRSYNGVPFASAHALFNLAESRLSPPRQNRRGHPLWSYLSGEEKNQCQPGLCRQAVDIKEVHDDIWLVSFMDYDLGYFDLETRVLEPLENPFGPKVLPM